MSALQATISFPGLSDILSADLVLKPGILPSACTLRIVPQRSFRVEVGELQFRYGNVSFAFPQCALQSSRMHFEAGGASLRLTLLDRRWKWQFGEINGDYNQRHQDGQLIDATRRSARQLAAICLQELGESNADVAAVPEDIYPRVEWNHQPPARALAALCKMFDCRVALGLDNRVRLHQIGVGRELPNNGTESHVGFGVESSLKPDSIRFVGGPTRFQKRLRLAAVGLERDGSIRPINELSYTPDHGWSLEYDGYLANLGEPENPAESALDRRDRDLALKSVFKWYAVVADTAGGVQVPGLGTIDSIERILPLHEYRLDHGLDASGIRQPLAPIVEGVFFPLGADRGNTADDTLYTDRFAVDRERGIVMFEHSVVRLGDNGETLPAQLHLTTSFQVRKSEKPAWHHEIVEERLPGKPQGTGAMMISAHEQCRTIIESRSTGGGVRVVDNQRQFQRDAKKRIAAVRRRFINQPQTEAHYVGLCRIEPDGAIDQVAWSMSSTRAAETIASRNRKPLRLMNAGSLAGGQHDATR